MLAMPTKVVYWPACRVGLPGPLFACKPAALSTRWGLLGLACLLEAHRPALGLAASLGLAWGLYRPA
jgi:hypothetical protein